MLYRGISINSGVYYTGYLCYVDCKPVIISPAGLDSTAPMSEQPFEFVIPASVSASTGIFDVNGTEIFENDIVETFAVECTYRQVGNYPPPNVEVEEWEITRAENRVDFSDGYFSINGWPLGFNGIGLDDEEDYEYSEYKDETRRKFEEIWNGNDYDVQDKWPYLTWEHIQKPHIIGHSYDDDVRQFFEDNKKLS